MVPSVELSADARLVRIVMRKAHDLGRDPLLVPVELADLDGAADLARADIDARERDRLAQHGRIHAGRHDTDAGAAGIDGVAVMGGLATLELEPDEAAVRLSLAALQCLLADEVASLGDERDRKPDAGLERVRLVRELVICEDQARFDAEHVKAFKPERGDAVGFPGSEDSIPQRETVTGMTPDLI